MSTLDSESRHPRSSLGGTFPLGRAQPTLIPQPQLRGCLKANSRLRYALSGRALRLPSPAFCCSRTYGLGPRKEAARPTSSPSHSPSGSRRRLKAASPAFCRLLLRSRSPGIGLLWAAGFRQRAGGGTQPGASPLDQGDCARRRTSAAPARPPRAQRQRQCHPLVGSPWVSGRGWGESKGQTQRPPEPSTARGFTSHVLQPRDRLSL